MAPARWFFRKHEDQPTTEVAIRRSPSEDLYIVLAGYDMQTQSATFEVVVNPLVNWIWFGFGIMAFGTGIALLPESALAFAGARVPSGAATTGVLIFLLLTGLAGPARAQVVLTPEQQALKKQLLGDIICTCGCRVPMKDCPMGPTCHGLQELNPKLDEFVAAGMNHEEVRAAFVDWYGSQAILAAPIDRGFNRLAWLFPYLIGGGGLLLVGVVAGRWSRKKRAETAAEPATAAVDPTLQDRLDDELRDLD